MEYELGVIRCSPLGYALKQIKSAFRTWWYCRENGYQTNEWYGVYEKGTENVVAQFGNMPDAKKRAASFVKNYKD